jgi:hypothetical protein
MIGVSAGSEKQNRRLDPITCPRSHSPFTLSSTHERIGDQAITRAPATPDESFATARA